MDYRYLLPPLVGAAIGWLTNYVAIKLLFRPHLPISILGFKLQGLIPKRRKDIARSMAQTIEKDLLSSKDIAATLNTIDWKDEVEKTVEEVVEHRFAARSIKKIPLVGLVSENLTYHIKYLLTREILRHIDKNKEGFAQKLGEGVDVQELLVTRIDDMDLKRFEDLLTAFISNELRHIEWIGGIMGFLIGLTQTAIFYFFR
ncbi:MAG: DUF445 family protein [Thermodesulfobacteriota bacterium]